MPAPNMLMSSISIPGQSCWKSSKTEAQSISVSYCSGDLLDEDAAQPGIIYESFISLCNTVNILSNSAVRPGRRGSEWESTTLNGSYASESLLKWRRGCRGESRTRTSEVSVGIRVPRQKIRCSRCMTMTGMMREYPQSLQNLMSCGTFPLKGRLRDVPPERHSAHVQLGRADPGPIHPRNAWMLSRRSRMRDGHGAPSKAPVQTQSFPFHSFSHLCYFLPARYVQSLPLTFHLSTSLGIP